MGVCLFIVPAVRRQEPWGFLLPVAFGVLLSAPFLRDGGLRVLIATLPCHVGLAVSAVAFVVTRMGRGTKTTTDLQASEVDRRTARRGAVFSWDEGAFAALLLIAVVITPLLLSLRPIAPSVRSWAQRTGEGAAKEVIFYYNPASGILLGDEEATDGVMVVPVASVTSTPMFGSDLRAAAHLRSGHYLYQAFFLQEPEHPNVVVRFNGIPEGGPGFLKVTLALLEERDDCSLYAADTHTRLQP
jgi:hypothetical protein